MSDRTPHRRPRRMATPAERQRVRGVANFIRPLVETGHPWLMMFALVEANFRGISLADAITAYLFRSLLPPPDLRLPADIADLEPWGRA